MKLTAPEYPSTPYLALERHGIMVMTRTVSILPAKVPQTAGQNPTNSASDAPIRNAHVAMDSPTLIQQLSHRL